MSTFKSQRGDGKIQFKGSGSPANGTDKVMAELVPKTNTAALEDGAGNPVHDAVLPFPMNATSLAVATDVFTADRPYLVKSIQETHSVGSAGVTLKIRKITDTSAPGAAAGATVKELIDATNSTASALDLNSTANTKGAAAARVLSLTASDLQLAIGDRIAFFPSGAPTGYVGQITIALQAL